MGYAAIAIVMALGVIMIGWPVQARNVLFRGRQYGSDRYWTSFARDLRLVGFGIVIGLPAYILLVVQ